jgi:hypothetical protein
VVPEFGLEDGVVEGGVVVDVLLLVPGVVVEALPLTLPVPVAPIEDVAPGDVLLLVVVSVLLEVLPVVVLGDVVLGDVLPLRLPEPVVLEPVVVEGVVVLLELVEPVAPVPLEPVVALSAPRWHAASENAAAMASATAVNLVFIRNSLFGVTSKVARAAETARNRL